MGNLNKIGIGLSVVFILSLVALFTELCYIFVRRRKQAAEIEPDRSNESNNRRRSSSSSSAKEILYLFCCGRASSIELATATATTTIHPIDDDNVGEDQQDVLAKWQQTYGPSRILFTIKEEEKEDLESEKSCSERKSKSITVSGLLEGEEKVVIMEVVEGTEFTETPYYTPLASPIHDLGKAAGNLRDSGGDGEYFVVEVEKLSPAARRGGSGS